MPGVVKLDVEAIRADLLGGEDIPGCAIGERGTHLPDQIARRPDCHRPIYFCDLLIIFD
jgi:hypothetical protein